MIYQLAYIFSGPSVRVQPSWGVRHETR